MSTTPSTCRQTQTDQTLKLPSYSSESGVPLTYSYVKHTLFFCGTFTSIYVQVKQSSLYWIKYQTIKDVMPH